MDIVLLLMTLIGAVLVILGLWFVWAALLDEEVETAKYRILRRLKSGVEIRRYGKALIAMTTVKLSGNTDNRAFGKIAGYIFGANKKQEKIAMTAPVLTSQEKGKMTMAFFMPKTHGKEDLPAPVDRDVGISEMPERTIAVIGFSWYADRSSVMKNEERLLKALEDERIKTRGAPFLLRYNAPWTPPPMMRNEVGIEVVAEEKGKRK